MRPIQLVGHWIFLKLITSQLQTAKKVQITDPIAQTKKQLRTVISRVNVTRGYTLVKTQHSRVPTYLQRETDTAD